MNREEFYKKFPEKRLTQKDIDAVNRAAIERDFDIAYAIGRQQHSLSHEEATQFAQKVVYGEVRSNQVGREVSGGDPRARIPLSSPLPEVVQEMVASPIPTAPSGRRMAMRYGLPSLGALLGLYALEAMPENVEQESDLRELVNVR